MIINWLYQSNSGYITIWGAAEVFSYYGTILAAILAAIVAVVGVHISIRASHEQYREDKRRDVLPYFAINMLDSKRIDPGRIGRTRLPMIQCKLRTRIY